MKENRILRLAAVALAASQALPAAAQRVTVELAPVVITGPSAVAGAALAAPVASSLATPGLTLAAPLARAAAPAPLVPAASLAAARPAAGSVAGPAQLNAPDTASAENGRRLGAKSAPAIGVQARRANVAAALPRTGVSDMSGASAHTAGVAVENAVAGGRSKAAAAEEAPVGGFWRSLIPSGLGRSIRSAAPAAVAPEAQQPAAVSAEVQAKVAAGAALVNKVRAEVGKVIVGQKEMVDSLLIAMISGEHVLLEGVPGVAKTATVKAFADATEADFQRIQGTPDKLPSDILGAEILQDDPATGLKVLKLEKGPVVTHILLVDEINRMMPKTQAALLEAMQERRITIGRNTIQLPEPFIVLATQNPIEQEGTYRLPEAQQDRFMLKVIVDRPTRDQLLEIMNRFSSREKSPKASKITTLAEFAEAGKVAEDIYASQDIQEAVANIVEATNNPEAFGLDLKKAIENGASPRAAIYLLKAARAHAFLQGRAEVNRSDIFAMAPMILRHRILLSYESQASKLTVEQVIQKVLESKKVWQGAPAK